MAVDYLHSLMTDESVGEEKGRTPSEVTTPRREVTTPRRSLLTSPKGHVHHRLSRCRTDVADNGDPGRGVDTFAVALSTGYAASNMLGGGNIQLHQPCQ